MQVKSRKEAAAAQWVEFSGKQLVLDSDSQKSKKNTEKQKSNLFCEVSVLLTFFICRFLQTEMLKCQDASLSPTFHMLEREVHQGGLRAQSERLAGGGVADLGEERLALCDITVG